jgi:hypothetical protein
VGVSNDFQNIDQYDSLSASLRKDLSSSSRTSTQSFLGYKEMKHGPQGSWHKKENPNCWAWGTEGEGLPQCQAKLYKERTKRWHDKWIKIKHFNPGDKVLLFNSHVHLFDYGKLHSKWEGPYLVLHATNHCAVTIQSDDGDKFKANNQRLKLFLEPNPLDFEEVDILNFLEIE